MQLGISPKVALPAAAQLVIGAALAIVGALTHNDQLLAIGLAVLGTGGVTGLVGYNAPAGSVKPPNVDVRSDDLLPPEARAQMEQ
jgi:hypothetical protein